MKRWTNMALHLCKNVNLSFTPKYLFFYIFINAYATVAQDVKRGDTL